MPIQATNGPALATKMVPTPWSRVSRSRSSRWRNIASARHLVEDLAVEIPDLDAQSARQFADCRRNRFGLDRNLEDHLAPKGRHRLTRGNPKHCPVARGISQRRTGRVFLCKFRDVADGRLPGDLGELRAL